MCGVEGGERDALVARVEEGLQLQGDDLPLAVHRDGLDVIAAAVQRQDQGYTGRTHRANLFRLDVMHRTAAGTILRQTSSIRSRPKRPVWARRVNPSWANPRDIWLSTRRPQSARVTSAGKTNRMTSLRPRTRARAAADGL